MARALIVVVVVFLFFVCGGAADIYVVGGSSGWDLKSNVGNWSSSRRFHVGDTLVFNYSSVHDVVELNRSEFQMCSFVNPIARFHGGVTVIFLGKTGHRYFVCSEHCNEGMKMQIQVLLPKLPRSPPRKCKNQPPPASPPHCGQCSCVNERRALIIVSSVFVLILLVSATTVGYRVYNNTASTTVTASPTTASKATTSPAVIEQPQSPLLAIEYPETQSSLGRLHAPEEALAMAERHV